jgi:hypothetical protein
MIVNRGPQFVHVMNGWRYRRSAGSNSSRRQSAHSATSGRDRRDPRPAAAGHDREARLATERPGRLDHGGDARERRGLRHEPVGEHGHRVGVALHLDEHRTGRVADEPERASSAAMRWTKGRKPTPCTTPVTV